MTCKVACHPSRRKDMVKVGDLCPIFFNPIKDKFLKDIDYVQKFYTSDVITIQTFADGGEVVSFFIRNIVSRRVTSLPTYTYDVNTSLKMHYTSFLQWYEGVYDIIIRFEYADQKTSFVYSEPFMISASSNLIEETCLIEFSNRDNNSAFDNIFWIGDTQQVFNFRIEAGFRPSGISQKVINEQFRNQFQEIEELYAVPYKVMMLQCGDSCGLPYWFAEFINKILCLSMFEIDGTGYVRSESSVPEMSQIDEYGQLFNFTIALERRLNNISGIGGRPESGGSGSVGAFLIDNPKDGEMLQYDESKAAFRNVDNIGV